MVATLDQIIKMNISLQTSSVQQAGFGIPLILGNSGRFNQGELFRVYADFDSVSADFQEADPEYIAAELAFSQELAPTEIIIGARSAVVAEVLTLTVPTVADATVYTIAVNGTNATYTSGTGATAASILAGLKAAIDALSEGITTVISGTTLTATAQVPGVAFSLAPVTGNLAVATSAPGHGIVNDIQAIQALNNDWYLVLPTSEDPNDILEAAAYIETQPKTLAVISSDSTIITTSTTDILSKLQALGYDRTLLMYTPQSGQQQLAGLFGGVLPQIPGSYTLKFKSIIGASPDSLTDTARSAVIGTPLSGLAGKNGNIYESVGGVPIFREGVMVSGRYFDLTLGEDWLKSNLQTAIMTALVSAAKVPYTNKGIGLITNAMNAVFKLGIQNGLIADDTPYTITFPDVSTISTANRANRILPDGKFTCRFAGALHSVIISGTVTV